MASAFAGFTALFVALAVILIVVWIILPFAVLGTKPLLRQLLAEQRRTNELLERQAARAGEVDRHHIVQDRVAPAKPFQMPNLRDIP